MGDFIYEVWRHEIIDRRDGSKEPVIVDAGVFISRHKSRAAAERSARSCAVGCLIKGSTGLGCVRENGEPVAWFASMMRVSDRGCSLRMVPGPLSRRVEVSRG